MKKNSMDLYVGEHFIAEDGKEYVVTEEESIGCVAEPVDKTGWDGIGFLFACQVVEVINH